MSWPAGWRRDLDLGIPAKLEERLAESVTDWRSPLVKHGGFCHWILAGASRTAYCPQCFKEDLEQGRIPYFRNDWIAVCVTSCWVHRTPLFQWCAIPARGVRRLPKEWIYQIDDPMAYAPDFFVRHLDLLDQLQQQPVPVSYTHLDVYKRQGLSLYARLLGDPFVGASRTGCARFRLGDVC